MPINAQTALAQLGADPLAFLRTYALWIQGNATHPSGTVQFEILDGAPFMNGVDVRRPGSFMKTRNMHSTQTFMVAHAALGFGGHAFQAHWLQMSEWTGGASIYNISVLTLDHNGPALMFTAGLTGCSVAVQDLGGGQIAVAHVRPNSDMDDVTPGAELDGQGVHRTLRRSGWTRVFGRDHYGDNRQVIVVGVRRHGNWQIFAQKQELPGQGPGDIRSAKKVYG